MSALDVQRLRSAFIRAGVVWVVPADMFEETVRIVASEYDALTAETARGRGRVTSQRLDQRLKHSRDRRP